MPITSGRTTTGLMKPANQRCDLVFSHAGSPEQHLFISPEELREAGVPPPSSLDARLRPGGSRKRHDRDVVDHRAGNRVAEDYTNR
jgi:hypothetical protein